MTPAAAAPGAPDVPARVRFGGRAKWEEVAFHLALAAVAAGGTAFIGHETALPAMRAVAAYTGAAAGISLVWAVALALTRHLPGVERTSDGSGHVVRAWPWPWWCTTALDLGLGCLGVALAVIAVGSPAAPWGFVVGVAGLWFLVRVGLVVLGRRHDEQLTVAADLVEHLSTWGHARAPRASAHSVSARGNTVVVRFDRDVELHPCPRPWRRARRALPDTIRFDASMVGHAPADLARWLAAELDVSQAAGGQPPAGRQQPPRR